MKTLREMGYEVEVACSNTGFSNKIEQEGFKVYNIPFSRNPLSYKNIIAVLKLYKIIKKNNYIMVHTHTPVSSFIGRIVAKIAGIPHVIYTVHGFHFHEFGNKLENSIYYHLEKFAGRFMDVLITINKDDYKVAIKNNMAPKGKVVYIQGVGVDMEKFDPKKYDSAIYEKYRKSLNIKIDDFVIISIGEFTKAKNFPHLIEAYMRVLNYKINAKLIIIGDGILFNNILKMIEENKLEGKVILTGRRNDIPELLYISNLFVFTSIREGLPKSIMEAMAMEKPIIAYNIRGIRDLVDNGVNGFLVKYGDINTFAEKILYLIKNPDIAKEMGKKGREKIEKEFSLKIILPQMKALYEEILSK
jgi:glycosyltransferase involved in cell wall biosynthesis